MTTIASRQWPKLELILIFGILPVVIAILKPRGVLALIIWGMAAYAWSHLKKKGYNWREEWNFAALNKASITPILKRFIPNALITLVFAWVVVPEQFFVMPTQRTQLWMLIMILYPLLSVIPQEIIFRSYFLTRYENIIAPKYMRLVNALAFGWVHIIMHNWIAVVFSAIGGWMFTDTYKKNKSLAAASFEHSLYGCFIFTVGLGMFFYHGNVK